MKLKVGDYVQVIEDHTRKGTIYRIDPAGDGYPAMAAFKGVCHYEDVCSLRSLEPVPELNSPRWRKN